MPYKDPEAARTWRRSRREIINARKRQLYASDPEHRARCLEQAQAGRSKNLYGVTRDQVAAQLTKQKGVCALCGREPSGSKRRLCIDHDHETGRFRGLLCVPCNAALGTLGDNEAGLLRAIAYVSSKADITSGSP